ncbi:NmrA family transcriptional regulator [Capsulimonas corticalis]|uniref:NmrA family transcriptional regulator n=1 Tax=Capsulimonas corticalis TaxID=2219043 RepID=A0A402CTQ2_9BACT|nr:NmrA family NAD(P)-binding protein [Capsulimonas corticalis]BDI30644.1 NmrA family transcriptional regulator [Capsulimonas corticalis]
MITVMGATGRTGNAIAKLLLDDGVNVRAAARSETKLAALAALGAETVAGDAGDTEFLTRAFQGADAVYTLLPHDPAEPDYHGAQRRMGEAIAAAIRSAGVRRVVFLSSVGADHPVGTGFVASLYDQEERLRQLDGVNVLNLRPGSFFENFHEMLPLIRQEGIAGDVVTPDLRIPMVATRDIAGAAAAALKARDWSGVVVRELLGPRDLSYAEAVAILGARIGKPDLAYVQFREGEMIGALTHMGCSADFARMYVELAQAINHGAVKSQEVRSSASTTPTRFEDFADELAQAYFAV